MDVQRHHQAAEACCPEWRAGHRRAAGHLVLRLVLRLVAGRLALRLVAGLVAAVSGAPGQAARRTGCCRRAVDAVRTAWAPGAVPVWERAGRAAPPEPGRLRRAAWVREAPAPEARRRSRRPGGAGFGSRRSRRGAAVRHGGRHRRRLLRHRYRGGSSRNRRGDNHGSRCGRRRLGRFSSAERLTKAARDGRLDRRRRGFDEFPLLAEPGENFFTRDTEFLGQLVHAGLACHYISCLEATAVVGAAPRV